ncbi:b(0,+)-type amino acid transporter 1 [Geranomyces variabilis]|nr:b(0,+)-type amino acid transporter 1 [Geranomyces variabilis]
MDVEAARTGSIPHLGFFDSLCIVVGTVVGIGIFGNPQSAYLELGSIGLTLVLWVFGGILTIAGAFCYAELGTAMPESGGEHNYLMRAFGPYAAYAFDWSQSLLSWPLSNAAVATIASSYIAKLILMDTSLTPDEQPAPATWITRLISVIIIVSLTLVNCVSSRFVAKVQRFLTVLKFAALLLVAGIGIYYLATNSPGNFKEPFKGSSTSVKSLGAGLTAILFSYGGFNNLSLMLGEMKQVERKLPLVLITSLSLVVIIYLVANVTYFAALPLDTIRTTHVIGLNVGYRAMGTGGSIVLSILIAICAFGTVNALTFGNGALIAAFAKDGIIFPTFLARAHPTRGTPIYALLVNAAFSLALVFAGNLDFLVNMYAFSSYFFFALTITGLLVMRFTHRDMRRPFRVWWPVAVLFLATALFIVAFPFVNSSGFSHILPFIVAMVFMAVPIPVVWFNLRRQRSATRQAAAAVAETDREEKKRVSEDVKA